MRGPAVLCFLVALLVRPGGARAEEHRLTWEWPRFRRSELIYTSAAWVSYAVVELHAPAIGPSWRGGLPGDDGARRALVLSTRPAREAASFWSDVMWIGTQVLVWADSLLVPIAFDRGNWDVASQLFLLNTQSMGATGLLTRLAHRSVGRERPSGPECERDPKYERFCGGLDAAGFPSGHASASFVAAGLGCAHHQHLSLYGAPAADAAGCVAILAGATANGVLRMMADRHYMSDVVAGAVLGFGLGYGLPVLLHYGQDAPDAGGAEVGAARIPLTLRGSF